MAILEFRRRIGFTQQQFGESAGVSASMVAQWESGKKDPSFDSLKRMLELGATVEELFGVDCRGSCPHAEKEKPDDTPQWARELMKRVDQLEQRKEGNAKAG